MPETRTLLWANNAVSALADVVLVDDTIIEVEDGSLFPSPASVNEIATIVLRDSANQKFEIMNVLSRSGNFLTVERGAEGTEAYEWPIGELVRHAMTAAFFDRFIDRSRRVIYIEHEIQSFDLADVGASTKVLTPNLPLVQEGDFILAVIRTCNGVNVAKQGSAEWLPINVDEVAGGTSDSFLNDSLGTAAHSVIAYRFVTANDTNPTLTIFNDGGNAWRGEAAFVVFRNVDPERPIGQLVVSQNASDVACTSKMVRTPFSALQDAYALTVDLLFQLTSVGSYDSMEGVVPLVSNVPQPILLSAQPSVGSTDAECGIFPVNLTDLSVENLLIDSVPYMIGAWTEVNGALSELQFPGLDDTFESYRINRFTVANGSSGRHEIYKDLLLPAGQYTFSAVAEYRDLEGLYFTVETSAGEVGVSGEFSTSVQRRVNIGVPEHLFIERARSTSSNHAWQVVIGFTLATPETVRFRIGGTDDASNYALDFPSGTGGLKRIELYATCLSQGLCMPPIWKALRADEYAVAGLNAVRPFVYYGFLSTANVKVLRIELSSRFSKIPPVVLSQIGTGMNADITADRKTILGNGGRTNNPSIHTYATAPVSRWIGPDEVTNQSFYFEARIDELVGPISSSTGVGYAAGIPNQNEDITGSTGSTIATTHRNTSYLYRIDGRIFRANTWVGSGPSYNAGDVIGAEIDFAANVIRFYKNGVLVGDMYGLDLLEEHANVPFVATIWGGTDGGDPRKITARFRAGEIINMPSGAIAYDFQN